MKTFWLVLAAGVALVALSILWSFLGDAASQRSDFGVIVGSLLVLSLLAVVTAVGEKLYRAHGSQKPRRKP